MKRESLLNEVLTNAQSTSQVKAVEIELAPKQKLSVHLHPIPVVGYILEGETCFQIENQPEQTLKMGGCFLSTR